MRRAGLAALIGLVIAVFAPFAGAASGYRSDFDFANHGDAWYGRFLPDSRRDFPANPADRASDGDDFGRGYLAVVASAGYGPPLELTDGSLSEYVFIAGSLAAIWQSDCDANGIEDQCDLSCGLAGGPCDVPGCGTGSDCDGNGQLDTCDVAATAAGCSFPATLADNSTGAADDIFLGPPDDVYYGLGGQVVTFELDCGWLVDGFGPDFNVYEVDAGSPEFGAFDVLVSQDGVTFFSVKSSEIAAMDIPGDEMHGNPSFARSYDLGPSGLAVVRFIRLDGNGAGPAGPGTGFDLDAIGIANKLGYDCDADGTLDACQGLVDCNADGIPESCEVAAGLLDDCDMNGTPDTCDTLGGTDDCDGDSVPDSCEADCNANTIPDDCDIAAMTSGDCNANGVPDECDLAATSVGVDSGTRIGFGSGAPAALTLDAPFAAVGNVTIQFTGYGDLDATNEYADATINGAPIGRLWQSDGASCVELSQQIVLSPEVFNSAAGSGAAAILATSPSTVAPWECGTSSSRVTVDYVPILDCNANGTLDLCDISAATSTDLNLNAIADDCELDCNGNAAPDDYDIAQGTSADCNANGVPDECDTGTGASADCNANVIPDECEVDCNTNAVPDDCDLAAMTSDDCNANAVPDECDLAVGAGGCAFPMTLLDNGTGADDAIFLGPPDDVYYGLGGQIVTFEFDCGFIVDGPGPDLTIYEVDSGSPEFQYLEDVLVSADGVTFVSIKSTESAAVDIPGDEMHGNASFARSYELEATGLNAVRFLRLDGTGTSSGGTSSLFDLDAVGAVNRVGVDCDGSGTLDACESWDDCNANALNDACEVLAGIDDDCDMNGDIDACDLAAGAPDVDVDWIPDYCEPDCNGNMVPDHYDIEQGTDSDCNHNVVPDACDLATGASQDCNGDQVPDECPLCPPVEVVFVVDTSSSMSGEGASLCSNLQQVIAELQADLVDVDVELLGILGTGGSTFSCLTDTVGALYGTDVPGSPAPGSEILGEPCGANLNEDWGPATAVIAGVKSWLPDSVRLIVPVSDEGPRCGDPVYDPGDDRDSILNAIGQAVQNDVLVSPITGSSSSAAVISMADLLAGGTGGTVFSTVDPAQDLADGIRSIVVSACNTRSDCNANGSPDDCDLASMTSQDCDMSGRPDECEADCNGNGLHDSCDIAAMTSQDANVNAVPDECEMIELTLGLADLVWTPVDGALGYDVVSGDLTALRSSGGDFTTATLACVVNDLPATSTSYVADPTPGEGIWFLVRAALGGGPLTYDAFGPGQVQGRDSGIAASAAACP